MKMLLQLYIRFRIVLSYVFIALLIGEFHPFTTFPMFSSMSSTSEYYYISDSATRPVYNANTLGIYCSEIRDMLDVRTGGSVRNVTDAHLRNAADEVLTVVVERNKGNPVLKRFNELRLCEVKFSLESHAVKREVRILATCKLN